KLSSTVQRSEIVVAAHMRGADENLRHRTPAAALHHFLTHFRLRADVDFREYRLLVAQQGLGGRTVRAGRRGVDRDIHRLALISALAGDERLAVTLPAADAALEAERTVKPGGAQGLHRTVALAAILADHDHPALFLDAHFPAFGQFFRFHMHGLDDMPGLQARPVADIDHRCPPVDPAH